MLDPDDVVEVELKIGDYSGSKSEQWEMKVTGDELPNPIKEQNHVFGTVITRTHNLFRKGNSYEINVNHIGTDPNGANLRC